MSGQVRNPNEQHSPTALICWHAAVLRALPVTGHAFGLLHCNRSLECAGSEVAAARRCVQAHPLVASRRPCTSLNAILVLSLCAYAQGCTPSRLKPGALAWEQLAARGTASAVRRRHAVAIGTSSSRVPTLLARPCGTVHSIPPSDRDPLFGSTFRIGAHHDGAAADVAAMAAAVHFALSPRRPCSSLHRCPQSIHGTPPAPGSPQGRGCAPLVRLAARRPVRAHPGHVAAARQVKRIGMAVPLRLNLPPPTAGVSGGGQGSAALN